MVMAAAVAVSTVHMIVIVLVLVTAMLVMHMLLVSVFVLFGRCAGCRGFARACQSLFMQPLATCSVKWVNLRIRIFSSESRPSTGHGRWRKVFHSRCRAALTLDRNQRAMRGLAPGGVIVRHSRQHLAPGALPLG